MSKTLPRSKDVQTSKSIAPDWVSAIAREIRGPEIPKDAVTLDVLAADWPIATKRAHSNAAEHLVNKGKLCRVMGKRSGDSHAQWYYYPIRKR